MNSSWNDAIEALRRYVAVRGAAPTSKNARAHGFAIGQWIEAQRGHYWAGHLNPEFVRILEEIPGWTWDGAHQRRWQHRLDALTHYATEHGATEIPSRIVVGRLHLGAWVTAQRLAYSQGRLAPQLTARLEALPGWRWTNPPTQKDSSRLASPASAIRP